MNLFRNKNEEINVHKEIELCINLGPLVCDLKRKIIEEKLLAAQKITQQ